MTLIKVSERFKIEVPSKERLENGGMPGIYVFYVLDLMNRFNISGRRINNTASGCIFSTLQKFLRVEEEEDGFGIEASLQ